MYLCTYVPPHNQRITMPQVTRGQVALNTLVALAEMSYVIDGKGFAENGQAPGEGGVWLRLTSRIARDAGKGAVGKQGKRKRSKATKAERDMVAGLGAILSDLGFVSGPNEEAEVMGAAA